MVNLLLVDEDTSFRLGLKVWLEKEPGWFVVGEAGGRAEAVSILQNQSVDLAVVEVGIPEGVELCRDIKQHYPATKIFLLSQTDREVLIEGALALGVEGYCPKGMESAKLRVALSTVAMGYRYRWQPLRPDSLWRAFRLHMRDTGLATIDLTLFGVNQRLSTSGLLPIERLVLEGRRRELRCARWLLARIWQVEQTPTVIFTSEGQAASRLSTTDRLLTNLGGKLTYSLDNLTDLPLEIDILLPDRRQELLQITVTELQNTLDRCRRSEVSGEQLHRQWLAILTDLWERVAGSFLGEYLTLGDRALLDILLEERETVQRAILRPIPLVPEVLSCLLFRTPITINFTEWQYDSPQAQVYLQDLLDHLCVQVANGVVQPLLNRCSDEDGIRQRFFRYRSSREIERFRNELSWKYRYNGWVREPRHIFESKYEVWVITPTGIDRVYINSSRSRELKNLQGWQLFFTLLLELQDALSPRLRSAIDWLGRGIVFLLTEIIGRGIGLIGRGIMRGIGYAWQPEGKTRRP